MCFFCLSFISWISGLSPFTCCKRAVTGALVAYVAAGLVVKAMNAILINAMVATENRRQKTEDRIPTSDIRLLTSDRPSQQKENRGDGKD
jgi:hypothetical protein